MVSGLWTHVHGCSFLSCEIRVSTVNIPPHEIAVRVLFRVHDNIINAKRDRTDKIVPGCVFIPDSDQESVVHLGLRNWDEKCLVNLAVMRDFCLDFLTCVAASKERLHRLFNVKIPNIPH